MRIKVPRPSSFASGTAVALAIVASIQVAGCGGSGADAEPEVYLSDLPVEKVGTDWNVVLVVIDTLRRDRLSTYGYSRATSPTIDRLAAEGVAIDAISPTSWTQPATVSILTGLHPLRHQTYSKTDLLSDDIVTLAESLAANGYQTMGLSANLWITNTYNVDQGFELFHDMGQLGYGHVAAADKVNEAVIPLLDSLKPPYFLYIHYIDPHVPYEPPMDWNGGELPQELAERVPMNDEDFRPMGFVRRDPAVVRAASDLYDGEIRFVDTKIGELIEELEARGLMSSTVTIITADHGEEFEDHGRMGHGHTLYGELTNVPLVFHAPGLVQEGRRLPRASLMDIVPTLTQLLDLDTEIVETPYPLDGRSFAAGLVNSDLAPVRWDQEYLLHLDYQTGRGLAIDNGQYKLVVTRKPYAKGLYRVETDPNEQNDLLSGLEDEEEFSTLAAALPTAYNDLLKRALVRERIGSLEQEVAEGLKALGYVSEPEEKAERFFPTHISAADSRPGGLLGIEDLDSFSSCVEIGANSDSWQLLEGWYWSSNPKGRWTWPTATAMLKVPEESSHITLRFTGMNFRRDTFTVRISVEDKEVMHSGLPHNRFEIVAEVPGRLEPGSLAFIKIEVDPPFFPWEHGIDDDRTLGTVGSRLCLEPS